MTFASRTQFHVERPWGQRPFSIVSGTDGTFSSTNIHPPVVEVGAGEGVDVAHIKLAVAGSVEGPGAVVADQPPGALRGGGGGLGGLGGLLGGGMGGLVTHAVQPVPRPVALLQLGVERGAGRTLVLLRVPGSVHVSRATCPPRSSSRPGHPACTGSTPRDTCRGRGGTRRRGSPPRWGSCETTAGWRLSISGL